jgi:MoaE-MoaD fusion protein
MSGWWKSVVANLEIKFTRNSAFMKTIKLLFFATLRDKAGVKSKEFQIPDTMSVLELKNKIIREYPGLQPSMESVVVAINREFAFDDFIIPDRAEVALFPPVSGGGNPTMDYPTIYSITDTAFDLNDLIAQITLPSSGAAAIFTGLVRGITNKGKQKETLYLEYDAYVPMAEAKMKQVAQEIRREWPSVEGIAIVQRIGKLYPTTPTVLIACTAAHRDTGVFEAARYGIDRLKEIVPVWKKEVGIKGEEWIEGDYRPKIGE